MEIGRKYHFLLLGREGENFQFKIGGEHFFINEVCPQEKILHQMADLSPCLFHVAGKITMNKANCREEGLFFIIGYGSSLRKVRKGTRSRDSWKRNRNRGHWGKLFPCFASRPMFNFFSHASQSHLPGDGTAHSCLSPLPSICNQESAPQIYPQENLIQPIHQLKLPLLTCINKTTKFGHQIHFSPFFASTKCGIAKQLRSDSGIMERSSSLYAFSCH